ncbi:hypothetical protein HAX54_013941, partial [Datura stramonium]|nr:hypothetical protein [Datura stramonium]
IPEIDGKSDGDVRLCCGGVVTVMGYVVFVKVKVKVKRFLNCYTSAPCNKSLEVAMTVYVTHYIVSRNKTHHGPNDSGNDSLGELTARALSHWSFPPVYFQHFSRRMT